MSRPAVFLDRDGVLIEEIVRADGEAYAPTELQDFLIFPDAAAQVARLHQAGFACVVVTNQPEIARGLLDPTILETMHDQLRETTSVDAIMVCPHVDADACECRKPLPGMLLDAATQLDIAVDQSFLVGDRWRDIDAGRAIGCTTVLIQRSYSHCSTADVTVDSLADAVDWILARSGS
jgi:D-glycero-D-manno-heptose 1,7-bisphosphate phosphatase